MNKKGSTLGVAILSFLGVLIVGFMFINFLLPEVTNFRINMSCSEVNLISDGGKVLCLVGDLVIPLFLVAIVALAIGLITKRFIF